MNLILDIGNTRAKLAVFEENTLVELKKCSEKKIIKKIKKIIEKYAITNSIVSSVQKTNMEVINFLSKNSNLIVLSSKTKIPFNNHYATPKTLGVDRIALIASAVKKFPNQNVLVIDAGTCITYDFVSDKKDYYGGAISPGIQMRYNAMNNYTKKLPQLEPKEIKNEEGNTTKKAMHKGVMQGVFYEIEGFIANYKAKNDNLTVVLTGGDKKILSNLLKSSIFAHSNFLLLGLNYILNYNLND